MSSPVSKKRPSTDGNRTPSDLNRPSTHDPASSPVRKKQASMSDIRTLFYLNHSSTQDSMSSSGSKTKPLTSGIRTLPDLNRTSTQNSNNNSDNPQQHHAVVEKSETVDQNPYNQIVNSIFNRATQMGAIQHRRESIVSSSRTTSFTGIGRTLSGRIIPSPPPQPLQFIGHTIIFWRNGFTVNDGPLRRMDDPENALFLEEPKKPQDPFPGVGRRLGSSSNSEASTFASINTQTPSTGFLDESLPSTLLQLRLADGTPVIGQFNYNHTVGDIRAFIDASSPNATGSYQLQTVGFPPTTLNDLKTKQLSKQDWPIQWLGRRCDQLPGKNLVLSLATLVLISASLYFYIPVICYLLCLSQGGATFTQG